MPPSPITEVAIAVVVDGANALIGPRPVGVPLAGYWEFPGGKLRPGELPAEGAWRECREETGLELASLQAWETVECDYPHGRLRLHFLLGRVNPLAADCQLPNSPSQPPRRPFRWVPVVDLPNYSFPSANRSVLAQLAKGVHVRNDGGGIA